MYLRFARRKKNGKTHTYWRVVRSVRVGGKVRQETVVHLGALDEAGRRQASALAQRFLGPRSGQLDLFEAPQAPDTRRIKLDAVRVENGRSFGDVWLGWTLWRALQLDEFWKAQLPQGRETVPWVDIATILVLARLCEPSSELHIAEDWYRGTALEDILNVPAESVHHRRLYEGLDQMLPHKSALEIHLRRRYGELFALEYDLLLYDVTSTYFEGLACRNPQAKRGHSRDHRPDCKQVCIGLVVTRDGFPLGYEVFDGNRVDVTTMKEMVETMETRHGRAKRVWVMDRGMTSEANLKWLRESEREYVVGAAKSELKRWEKAFLEHDGWKKVRQGLDVKLCSGPGGTETFLLCRSEDRREKERAMHTRFRGRIREALGSLGRRLRDAASPVDRGPVERQIGRLLGHNSRAAGAWQVDLVSDPRRKSGLLLKLQRNRKWSEWAALSEGAYVLRSNVSIWTPEELWKTYMQLCEAESAFRVEKSELQIRPIWHHRQDRTQAHIFVCFLAYALWKTLQGWQRSAGLGDSPRTVLNEVARLQSVDVVLPFVDGGEARLRCVVKPDGAQAALLDRLGLTIPRRLRPRSPPVV